MSTARIEYLVELYFSNIITEIQKEELANCVLHLPDEQIKAMLQKAWADHVPHTYMPDDISDKIITSLLKQGSTGKQDHILPLFLPGKRTMVWWKTPVAAACVLTFILLTIVFWIPGSKKPGLTKKTVQQNSQTADVLPGGQRALLVLSDGTRIVLDSASSGIIAHQGAVQVKKLSNGKIVYSANEDPAKELVYNMMSTPTGGTYQLILPDGTGVWLNSASSIRYPTAFGPGERRVTITGEAYFEVAKNAAQPFIVTVNNRVDVKVLGTHFNVNAYNDEADIKTTLMEGAINISQGKSNALLAPGQQAQVDKNGSIRRVKDVDLEEAIAWKKGFFLFNSAGLPEMLRQAARWYSLEIVYEGKIPGDKFSGQISRSVNLSSLLKWIQWSDVHFKLEGRKLIIRE